VASRLTLATRNREAIAARFAAVVPAAQRRVAVLVRETAEYEYALVYHACPVDTGYMRAHITVFMDADDLAYTLGWVDTDFGVVAGLPFYPPYVIFGTRYQAGRDFLFPNHELAKARFRGRLRKAMASAYADAGRARARGKAA
jgi:hypothetical protein